MILSKYSRDFSAFFTGKSTPVIPDAVLVVVGASIFHCSGCILAQLSPVLLKILAKLPRSNEVFLDEFIGCEDGVEDCINLLYGAEVAVGLTNIQTLLKFSLLYEIKEMTELCAAWFEESISFSVVYAFINIGLFFNCMDYPRVLAVCKRFMVNNPRSEESEESLPEEGIGKLTGGTDLLKFLLDKDIMHMTLRVLPLWVDSEEKATCVQKVMDQLKFQDHYFEFDDGDFETLGLELIRKIRRCSTDCQAISKLMKMEVKFLNRITNKRNIQDSFSEELDVEAFYLSKCWRIYSSQQMMDLHFSITSNHLVLGMAPYPYFSAAELLVDWIREVKPEDVLVKKLWKKINDYNSPLPIEYLEVMRNSIMAVRDYSIPEIDANDNQSKFKPGFGAYKEISLNEPEDSRALKWLFAEGATAMHWYCTFSDCKLSSTKHNNHERMLKLKDGAPCYELDLTKEELYFKDIKDLHRHDDRVEHWYTSYVTGGRRVLLSLLTNERKEVTKVLRGLKKEHLFNIHCIER